jgi:hypothetical protein
MSRFVLIMTACVSFHAAAMPLDYTYSGDNFDSFKGSTYSSSNSVAAFFSPSDFLVPKLVKESLDASIIDYEFTDGVNTISKGDSASGFDADVFTVEMVSSCNITLWGISISQQPFTPSGLGDFIKLIRTKRLFRRFTF